MIGTRGHDIGGLMNEVEFASQLEELGFDSVQLVAYKSIEGVSESAGYMSTAKAFRIGRELSKRGIHIGLIGSYFNMLDDEVAEAGKERFKEYIKYARDLGGSLVGSETGSFNKGWTYHPDNHSEKAYKIVYETFKELVDEAEKHGVFVAIEGAWHHSMGTPKMLKRLIDDLDSSNTLVILDPYNFLNIDNYQNCNEIIAEAFELMGDKISVIHAKDFVVEDGKLVQVPLGRGLMDYPFIKETLAKYKSECDIIIEGSTGDGLKESLAYLKTMFE